jgi:ribosome maturation factor RimP
MQANLEKIMNLAESTAQALGLEVVEVRFGQQGKKRSLEVTIYRPGGRVALADCEQVSRALDEVLETQNPPLIDFAFLLDVQSPGIDRKLSSEREFKLFAGQQVEVKTKQKIDELACDHAIARLTGLKSGRVSLSHPRKAEAPKANRKPTSGSKRPKGSAKEAALVSAPESVEIELDNVIYVRLLPEEFNN